MGLITAVISAAIIVTFRQADSTEGRLNVARAEQNIGFYMPNDLASAAEVDTDPAITPCGTSCPPGLNLTGSNALLLTWTTTAPGPVETLHNVSYHYYQVGDGEYQVDRVECESVGGGPFTCDARPVLRELSGPPGGGGFFPGSTVPHWVLQVSEPLAPDAVNETQLADAATRKDANRVVVTVNGGGGADGAGGGVNQISITAGGTSRDNIPPDSVFNAPSFAEARSRCGGPITIIADDSGSVGSTNVNTVEAGIRDFVTALAGTPTKVQIVRFDRTAGVISDSGAWSQYFDMLDQGDVDYLTNPANIQLTANGSTNWEDAWFRAIYNADGTFQDILPETVVFFTDGEPTAERYHGAGTPETSDDWRTGDLIPGNPPAPGPGWPTYSGGYYSNGSNFSQIAFNRADWIVDEIRSATRIIGVGVGNGIDNGTVTWVQDPGAWFHYDTYRGFRQFQKSELDYERATRWRYQQGYHWSGGRRVYSAPYTYWRNRSQSQYNANNTTPDESDGWRSYPYRWRNISQSQYDANNTTPDESDGYRARPGGWSWISEAEYNDNNTTGDDSDGYRDAGKQYVTRNSDAFDWELWPTTESGGGYDQRPHYDESHKAHTHREPGLEVETTNRTVLSRLVAGSDNAVEGIYDGGEWTNVDVAEMFILPDFSTFKTALKSIALGECGGTVTVSTTTNGGTTADPVTFQNSRVFDESGTQLAVEPSLVYTNSTFKAATFDFSIDGGAFVEVEIVPHNLSDLGDYSPAGTPWSCKVGNAPVDAADMAAVPITDSVWQGVHLTVRANEAVSCVMKMTR
jgi:hypothetical protein